VFKRDPISIPNHTLMILTIGEPLIFAFENPYRPAGRSGGGGRNSRRLLKTRLMVTKEASRCRVVGYLSSFEKMSLSSPIR